MKEVLQFIFNLISEFISTSMTWKIYGNLSLTHFIFGFILVAAVLSFLTFGVFSSSGLLSSSIDIYSNAENKKEKANYYHMTKSTSHGDGVYTHVRFKVNRKTGEVRKI